MKRPLWMPKRPEVKENEMISCSTTYLSSDRFNALLGVSEEEAAIIVGRSMR